MLTIYKQATNKTRRSSSSILLSFVIDKNHQRKCYHHNGTASAAAAATTYKSTQKISSCNNKISRMHSIHNKYMTNCPLQIRSLSNDKNDPNDIFTPQDMEFYDDLLNDPDLFHKIASTTPTTTPPPASFSDDDDIYDDELNNDYSYMANYQNDEYKNQIDEEKQESKRQLIRDELDSRTGRLWKDPWEITDEDWSSGRTYDDLPDWNETLCSRVSLQRVKVHSDGVPTLDVLANSSLLNLPPSHPPHPALGQPQPYLSYRKKLIYKNIYDKVVTIAKPEIEKIQSKLTNWNDKQDAIDDLFEQMADLVKTHSSSKKGGGGDDDGYEKEYYGVVLGSQPDFPKLVEKALEEYLRSIVRNEKSLSSASNASSTAESSANNESDSVDRSEKKDVANDQNQQELLIPPEPIFMDLLKLPNVEIDSETKLPKLIAPIKPHPKDGPGRMVEEWELSANDKTRRIMIRKCISDIASSLSSKEGARVFVHGREGAGKSAALVAMVASARISGHIVLYLPDGHRLNRHGYYIEPNSHSKKRNNGNVLFDLPILTNEVCKELMESHEKDLEGMVVSEDVVKQFLSVDEIQKHLDKEVKSSNGVYNLVDLLKVGSHSVNIGAGCYGTVIHSLMNQDDKPFTVIMDEFNCYFDQGHYFHADYDPTVRNSIPANKITLFKPFLDAVGVEKLDGGSIIAKNPVPMKKGGIVVGVTESHAIGRKYNEVLKNAVQTAGCNLVDVPQYSPLEVEHILANFEITGIGRLRFDRGATVMNKQEVAFLRMVSGGIGQRLLDACVS